MFCSNCGSKNNEKAMFCSNCGAKLNGNIESQEDIVTDSLDENTLTDKVEDEKAVVPVNNSIAAIIDEEPVKKRKPIKKLIGLGAILIVLLGAGFFILNSGFFSKDISPIIYLKDNKLLVRDENKEASIEITNSLFEDKELLNGFINGIYHNIFLPPTVVNNGNDMFFLNDIEYDEYFMIGELYYRNTHKEKPDSKEADDIGIKLSSNVLIGFKVSEDEKKVAYIKDADVSGGKLVVHDLKEEIRIASEVKGDFYFSQDGNSIMYGVMDKDSYYDYYIKPITEESVKEKVDGEITSILYNSPDLKKIYYTKSDDKEKGTIAVYLKEAGKDSSKVVGDITEIIDIDENGNIFYTKSYEEKISLETLVTDDLSSADAAMYEPLLDDFITGYNEYYYYYPSPIYDYDAYYAKYDEYNQKLYRDSLREDLKNNPTYVTKMDLYMYSQDKNEKISSDINHVYKADSSKNTVLYSKNLERKFDKLKISQISHYYDVTTRYWSSEAETDLYLYTLGNEPNKILPNYDLSYITVTDDFKNVYGLEEYDSSKEKGTLVKHAIGQKESKEVISDDVNEYTLFKDSNILYFKDHEDGVGELYLMKGSEKKKVASEVPLYSNLLIDEDTDTVICLEDYNSSKNRGTLVSINGFEKTQLADDVNFFYYRGPNNILYMTDYSDSKYKGELWIYKGKDNKVKLDDDVTGVLAF